MQTETTTQKPDLKPTEHAETVSIGKTRKSAHKSGGGLLLHRLGLLRFSGLYGIAAMAIVFALLMPSLFPTPITLRTILSDQAITGILVLASIVPLVGGLIDISFGSLAGFALVMTVWLTTNVPWDFSVIVVVTIAATTAFGLLSGVMIALLRLDSLIVTLGVGTLALGFTQAFTQGNTLTAAVPQGVTDFAQGTLGSIPNTAIIFAIFAVVMYIWLDHTKPGRYLLASGSNPVAARLAGVRVFRFQMGSMLFTAFISGCTGILLAAQLGSATSTIGPGYLLPVLAVLFLGATQVKLRVNILGSLIALVLLGVLIKGLQLLGASPWVIPFFNGLVLLVAVTLTASRAKRTSTI